MIGAGEEQGEHGPPPPIVMPGQQEAKNRRGSEQPLVLQHSSAVNRARNESSSPPPPQGGGVCGPLEDTAGLEASENFAACADLSGDDALLLSFIMTEEPDLSRVNESSPMPCIQAALSDAVDSVFVMENGKPMDPENPTDKASTIIKEKEAAFDQDALNEAIALCRQQAEEEAEADEDEGEEEGDEEGGDADEEEEEEGGDKGLKDDTEAEATDTEDVKPLSEDNLQLDDAFLHLLEDDLKTCNCLPSLLEDLPYCGRWNMYSDWAMVALMVCALDPAFEASDMPGSFASTSQMTGEDQPPLTDSSIPPPLSTTTMAEANQGAGGGSPPSASPLLPPFRPQQTPNPLTDYGDEYFKNKYKPPPKPDTHYLWMGIGIGCVTMLRIAVHFGRRHRLREAQRRYANLGSEDSPGTEMT